MPRVLHLAIVVWPEEGESFQSWIRRYSSRLKVSALQLYQCFAFTQDETRLVASTHGFKFTAGILKKLSEATAIPADVLRATAFDRFDHMPSLEFDEDNRLKRLRNWVKGTHSRYCPQCLSESGGAFQLTWQLGWTFVCTRHHSVLQDWCWSCQGPISVMAPPGLVSPASSFCFRELEAGENKRRERCDADLTEGHAEPLPVDHPVVQAQIFVSAFFEQGNVPDQRLDISDLRAMCLAVLAVTDRAALEQAANLSSGELAGLEPDSRRVGAVVPSDALFFGALICAAKPLLTGTEKAEFRLLRELVFSKTGKGSATAWWKNGPTEVINTFGGSEHTRRRIAHAIDADLTSRQRIWFASATPASSETAVAGVDLPDTLWGEWLYALNPGGPRRINEVRRTLDATVKQYGGAYKAGRPEEGGFAAAEKQDTAADISSLILADNSGSSGDFIEAIAYLFDAAGKTRPRLSYNIRKSLVRAEDPNFFPLEHLVALRKSVGARVDVAPRYSQARAYAYERLTGSYLDLMPQRMRRIDGLTYRRPHMTDFLLGLSAQLKEAIDHYLGLILEEADLEAPIHEMPALDLLPTRLQPGGRIDELNLKSFHELLERGVRTVVGLGRSAGISAETVPLVAAARPPHYRSQHSSTADWAGLRRDIRASHVVRHPCASRSRI
ncbi:MULTISPECIES: TniQ family protein [unclassified Frigoribacterium]|uniref:TniQ family protein n=1 Tax=unclassified Frigoribacterium TaxID=2627005 RepID=UPI0009EA9D4E|nr:MULTISPECIES: TniQ family protein [unclassified Frigoribacterium]ROS53908.1 TniQ protein [Frigoribacterium sp. PhB118]